MESMSNMVVLQRLTLLMAKWNSLAAGHARQQERRAWCRSSLPPQHHRC